MIRHKRLFLLALIFLLLFILSTIYLLFILPSSDGLVKELPFSIKDKIYEELQNLPIHYKLRSIILDTSTNVFLENLKNNDIQLDRTSLVDLWTEANRWLTKTQLLNLTSPNLGKVCYAIKNAAIIKADLDTRGTQLKLLLTLQGNQLVVFKPRWYPIDHIIEGPVYAGKDRYVSEILAFYLSAILQKPLTPISMVRKLSIRKDIIPVATERLLETTFENNNKTCIYGKCFFCKKEDPVCTDEDSFLDGAVIFNIKANFTHYRSPWQRTYKKGRNAIWQEFPESYCKTVRGKLPKRRIYDLIDTSIFDFLIQNGDRHHYEMFYDTVIWLDNGKGLGNPNVHHIDILAPLYQCCILRRDTWKTLLSLTGGKLREKLELMPDLDNLVTKEHLKAIEERLLLVFATIEYCRHLKQDEHRLL